MWIVQPAHGGVERVVQKRALDAACAGAGVTMLLGQPPWYGMTCKKFDGSVISTTVFAGSYDIVMTMTLSL